MSPKKKPRSAKGKPTARRAGGTQPKPSGPRRSAREDQDLGQLGEMELLSLVCNYFCQGRTPSEIAGLMKNKHTLDMSRERPYQLIAHAATNGWLRFRPPREYSLGEHIRDRYGWLHDAHVVQTAVAGDVAREGAEMLLDVLRNHFTDREAHVGFSGGSAMRQLAQHFAESLRRPTQRLPRKIVFHALVAGFDVFDPPTDPNAFFTYFVKDPAMQVDTAFVGLHAPAVVEPEQLPKLKRLEGIRQSYEHAGEIDIIVTSARDWRDKHSALRRYLEVAGQSLKDFKDAGAIGDILWRPIGSDGPVEIESKLRAMTVMELSDVHKFVEAGKRVLLVAGPCSRCYSPKTDIVKTVLGQKKKLITHLVIDSRCAREVLDGTGD